MCLKTIVKGVVQSLRKHKSTVFIDVFDGINVQKICLSTSDSIKNVSKGCCIEIEVENNSDVLKGINVVSLSACESKVNIIKI